MTASTNPIAKGGEPGRWGDVAKTSVGGGNVLDDVTYRRKGKLADIRKGTREGR